MLKNFQLIRLLWLCSFFLFSELSQAYIGGSSFCSEHFNPYQRFHLRKDPIYFGKQVHLSSYTKKPFQKGLPTILFIAGGPGASPRDSEFDLMGYNIIFFEPRGLGCSKPDSKATFVDPLFYSTQQTVDDIKVVLEDYKVDKAIVYGHSYGTMVATIFAHRYPKLVELLVLEGVLSEADVTLWRSELRRKHLQNVFDKLDQDQKDLIINLSEDQKLSPFWFSAVGNMMSYLDNSEEVFLNFLNNILKMEREPLISFLQSFIKEKSIDKNQIEETSDDLMQFAMLTCQELGGEEDFASLLMEFDVHRQLQWKKNSEIRKNLCEPLRLHQKWFFSSQFFQYLGPTVYLVGSDDGATDFFQAIRHFRNNTSQKKYFYVLKRGGHLPNLAALKEDRPCESAADCATLKSQRIQKDFFLSLLSGRGEVSSDRLDYFNSQLEFKWEKIFQ